MTEIEIMEERIEELETNNSVYIAKYESLRDRYMMLSEEIFYLRELLLKFAEGRVSHE